MAITFLKRGKDSQALLEQEKRDAALRQSEYGKMFRFFLKPGEEAKVTFVDGSLDNQGFLTPPRYYEHFIYHNGKHQTFVCPEKTDPASGEKCPICQGGDTPSLVSLFTVIDHRMFTTKNGEQLSNTQKLLVVKPRSMEIFSKYANKREGLAGCTFDVSRTSKESAAIGDVWDFSEKRTSEELTKVYTRQIKDEKTGKTEIRSVFVPADYDKEITYRSAEELVMLGFSGNAHSQPYQAPTQTGGVSPAGNTPVKDAEWDEEMFPF